MRARRRGSIFSAIAVLLASRGDGLIGRWCHVIVIWSQGRKPVRLVVFLTKLSDTEQATRVDEWIERLKWIVFFVLKLGRQLRSGLCLISDVITISKAVLTMRLYLQPASKYVLARSQLR